MNHHTTPGHAMLLVLLTLAFPAGAAHELDGRDIGSGEELYQEHCASCHGVELEGQPNWTQPGPDGIRPAPPHDASGHTWHHDNDLLFNYTRLGGTELLRQRGIENFASGMPGFRESLTDAEIWDILAFIRSTWPAEIQGQHKRVNPAH